MDAMTELRHRMEVIRSRRQRGKLSGSDSIVVSKLCLRAVYYSLTHRRWPYHLGRHLAAAPRSFHRSSSSALFRLLALGALRAGRGRRASQCPGRARDGGLG